MLLPNRILRSPGGQLVYPVSKLRLLYSNNTIMVLAQYEHDSYDASTIRYRLNHILRWRFDEEYKMVLGETFPLC